MLPVCLAHTASLAPWLPGLGPCKGKLRSACIYLTQIKGRGRGLQLEFHSEVHFLGEFQAESRSVTNTFDAVKRLVLVWKKPCIFSGKSEALSIFLGWGVGGGFTDAAKEVYLGEAAPLPSCSGITALI